MRGQILDRDRGTGVVEPAHVGPTDVASIEDLGAGLCDPGERGPERRLVNRLACRRRAPVREEDRGEPGIGSERLIRRGEGRGERARDGHAVDREFDRARERAAPREDRPGSVHRAPPGDRARDGDRDGAADRHQVTGVRGVRGVRRPRRPSARADREGLAVGSLHQGEEVAADTAHVRVRDGQDGGGPERRVDRVAAVLERSGAREGRFLVRRGDRPGRSRGRSLHGREVTRGASDRDIRP